MLYLRFGQVWDGHGAVEHVFLSAGVIFLPANSTCR
jgi:hypothetical protein